MAFYNGVGGAVTFTPQGGSELAIANDSWEKNSANAKSEVTNALSGAHRLFIPGISEGDGSFSVVWDSAAPPESGGLTDGVIGVVKEYLGLSGKFYATPVLIDKIGIKVSPKEGAIMYSVTYTAIGPRTLN